MISFNVGINAEDLVEQLIDGSDMDPEKLILALDEAVGDQGFTLHLVSELIKVVIRDNGAEAEYLASKSLEQNFDPAHRTFIGPASETFERNYSAEWEEQQTISKTLSQIDKLLNTVLEAHGML